MRELGMGKQSQGNSNTESADIVALIFSARRSCLERRYTSRQHARMAWPQHSTRRVQGPSAGSRVQ